MALLYPRLETHGALVGKLLRDGEAVRVPVATEKRQQQYIYIYIQEKYEKTSDFERVDNSKNVRRQCCLKIVVLRKNGCCCCLHVKNRSDLYPIPSLSYSLRQRNESPWSQANPK